MSSQMGPDPEAMLAQRFSVTGARPLVRDGSRADRTDAM
jgi:hypothetical protein